MKGESPKKRIDGTGGTEHREHPLIPRPAEAAPPAGLPVGKDGKIFDIGDDSQGELFDLSSHTLTGDEGGEELPLYNENPFADSDLDPLDATVTDAFHPDSLTQSEGEGAQQMSFDDLFAALEEEEKCAEAGLLVLNYKYRIGEEIARGGMGRVVEVTIPEALPDERPRPLVAKLVRLSQIAADGSIVVGMETQAVLREAQLFEKFMQEKHPQMVVEHGIVDIGGESHYVFIMERFGTQTLDEYMKTLHAKIAERRDRALTDEELLHITAIQEQLLAAAVHARKNGILHRDVKGANVLVDTSGEDGIPQIILMDFGVAKKLVETSETTVEDGSDLEPEYDLTEATGRTDIGIESDGIIKGTPFFMSSERFVGGVGEWDDGRAIGLLISLLLQSIRRDDADILALEAKMPRIRKIAEKTLHAKLYLPQGFEEKQNGGDAKKSTWGDLSKWMTHCLINDRIMTPQVPVDIDIERLYASTYGRRLGTGMVGKRLAALGLFLARPHYTHNQYMAFQERLKEGAYTTQLRLDASNGDHILALLKWAHTETTNLLAEQRGRMPQRKTGKPNFDAMSAHRYRPGSL